MSETFKTTSAKLTEQEGNLFFLRDPIGMFRSVGKLHKIQGGWTIGNTFFNTEQVEKLELERLSIHVRGV